jgi:hypothetical protein
MNGGVVIGCGANTGCFISISGTAVFQFDLSAALILLI